jgi:DNA-binding MarR family transcriptional regulator
MAELTQLDEKLAEVMGLAQAAKETTSRVGKLVKDSEVKDLLRRMRDEADETAKRCEAVASERDGKKSAIKAKARETKGEAQQMRDAYLGDDADGWTASSS